MATKTIVLGDSMHLADDAGHVRGLRLASYSPPDLAPGMVQVEIIDSDGKVLAVPVRFKMSNSGGRIAADFPGCDPAVVITDANGQITNG